MSSGIRHFAVLDALHSAKARIALLQEQYCKGLPVYEQQNAQVLTKIAVALRALGADEDDAS
jgi:hypothetical protein